MIIQSEENPGEVPTILWKVLEECDLGMVLETSVLRLKRTSRRVTRSPSRPGIILARTLA